MSKELQNETHEDIERRKRLQEWFKAEPEAWKDIAEEFRNAHRNELSAVKARTCTSREWSAGYVSGLEYILDLERWIRKSWTPPKETTK